MSKYYLIEMPDNFDLKNPCINCSWRDCENHGIDGYMFNPGCPIAKAKEVIEAAKGKVKVAEMVEESTMVGGTDMSFAFPEDKNIIVFYVEDK